MRKNTILLLVLNLLISTNAFSKAKFHQSKLNSKFTQALSNLDHLSYEVSTEGSIASISVGIVNKEGLVWSASYGYSNVENKTLANDKTIYRVGSLAKTLTATAILQLEEADKIDLDQSLNAFLPRFYIKSRFSDPGVITVRNLITHHSGIPTDINKGFWTEQRFTELVEDLRNEYLSYPANFIKNYSNLGYSLLGSIIENNTNYSYEEYMQAHLLTPLGMSKSNFKPFGDESKHASIGYNQGIAQNNLPIRDIPALGLNTSITDYAHFVAALLNKGRFNQQHILAENSVDELFSVQNNDVLLDMDNKVGLPWIINGLKKGEGIIASHSGTTINYSSEVMILPKQQIGIILLSNSNAINGRLKYIGQSFFNEIMSEQTFKTQHYHIKEAINSVVLDASKLQNRYISDRGVVEISPDKGELCDCNTQRTLDLIPMPNGWFAVNPSAGVSKTKVKEETVNGVPVLVVEKNGKKEQIGSKILSKNIAIPKIDWKQHYGGYKVINPDKQFPVTDIQVFTRDDTTYMCYKMPKLSDQLIVLPLQPISEKEAITQGLGRSKGETVYVQQIDGQSVLTYSGFVAEKTSDL